MAFLEKLKKAVSISRPLFWLGPPAAYALGLAFGGTLRGSYETWEFLLMSFPLSFFIYALNDMYDVESDAVNPRKGGAWGVKLEKADLPWVKNAALLFTVVFLATAALSLNPLHIFFAVLGLLLCYFYSAPPLRLKNVPIVDSLVNGGYGFVAFAFGCSLSGSMLFLHPYVLLATLCISGIHAITTIMDVDSDRQLKERTFATACGPRAPAIFAFIIFAISFVVFLNSGFQSLVLASGGVLATVATAYLIWKPEPAAASLAFKAFWVYGLLVCYYYLIKYMLLGHWDFSEQEFQYAKIFWSS